jgi:uncharacterized protein YndB with AHSA1/START domain
MNERSVTHATFVIERTYDAPPAKVFAAWADSATKSRWFVGPDEFVSSDHQLDFRVGGHESVSGGPPEGPVHRYDATYRDIVPNERIVTTYEMHMDDIRTSVSVATLELRPEGEGTRLTLTEQGAYLDGHDNAAAREEGTRGLLDSLGRELRRQPAPR